MENSLREQLSTLQQQFDEYVLRRYKAHSEECEALLEQELHETHSKLTQLSEKHQSVCEEHAQLRTKYTRTEAELAAAQSRVDLLLKEATQLKQQTCSLETLNDQWEHTVRVLEHDKQDLEDRLHQAEEAAAMLQLEVDDLHGSHQVERQRLTEECNDLKHEIQLIRQKPHLRGLKILAKLKPGSSSGLFEVSGSAVTAYLPSHSSKSKQFHFDHVLLDEFSELHQYARCLLQGQTACILSYGQSGSGKTQTVYQIIQELARILSGHPVLFSAQEIYNEHAALLQSPIIEDLVNAFQHSLTQRQHASRSHVIYSLQLGTGLLQLADLAGSERINLGACKGAKLKETLAVNKSLSTLQEVLIAAQLQPEDTPYEKALLTQCLRPSLQNTALILNCSQSPSDIGESLCTLAVGSRLRNSKPYLRSVLQQQPEFMNQSLKAAFDSEEPFQCTRVQMRSFETPKHKRPKQSLPRPIRYAESRYARRNKFEARCRAQTPLWRA